MLKHIIVSIIVAAITAIVVVSLWTMGNPVTYPAQSTGGTVETLAQSIPALTLGAQGNQVSKLLVGTCNPAFNGTSLAATSTGQFLCRNANVRAGDRVFVSLPIGSRGGLQGGFVAAGNGYATTTGWFGFEILNMTGAATTSFAQATTGIQYMITSTSTPR